MDNEETEENPHYASDQKQDQGWRVIDAMGGEDLMVNTDPGQDNKGFQGQNILRQGK